MSQLPSVLIAKIIEYLPEDKIIELIENKEISLKPIYYDKILRERYGYKDFYYEVDDSQTNQTSDPYLKAFKEILTFFVVPDAGKLIDIYDESASLDSKKITSRNYLLVVHYDEETKQFHFYDGGEYLDYLYSSKNPFEIIDKLDEKASLEDKKAEMNEDYDPTIVWYTDIAITREVLNNINKDLLIDRLDDGTLYILENVTTTRR